MDQFIGFLRTAAGGLLLLLIVSLAAFGQSPSQNVLVIRNVQIVSEPGEPMQRADVLVTGGVVRRVNPTTEIPREAMSMDGGGNILSVDANGSIRLTQTNPSPAMLPAAFPVESEQTSSGIPVSEIASTRNVPQTSKPAAQQPAAENLAQDVTDPTAPLTTITFQNRYVPSHWGIDDDLNEFSLQIALPYKLGGKRQIFRAILPYLTDTPFPEKRGAGDTSLANITLFPQKGWVFAAGGVVSLGNNKGPGIDTFAAGPAIAAITKKGKFLFGFLNQNLFSFGGDVKISQLQPIVSYTLNKKVSFAIGDSQIVADWNKGELVAFPLSFQINYIAKFGKQPIRLFLNPQYNAINSFGQRKWTVGGGFALILR